MANMKFNFDKQALNKFVESAAKEAATEAVSKEVEREMSALHRSHRGKPADEIKPAAKAALQRAGIKQPGADQINAVAEAVSRGEKPTFTYNFRIR